MVKVNFPRNEKGSFALSFAKADLLKETHWQNDPAVSTARQAGNTDQYTCISVRTIPLFYFIEGR